MKLVTTRSRRLQVTLAVVTAAALSAVPGGGVRAAAPVHYADACYDDAPDLPGNTGKDVILADHDGQTLTGTGGADYMSANGYSGISMNGLGGDDEMCAGIGGGTITGGPDNDFVLGVRGTTIDGGAGDDFISAGPDSEARGSSSAAPPSDSTGTTHDSVTGGPGEDRLGFGEQHADSDVIDAQHGTAAAGISQATIGGFESYSFSYLPASTSFVGSDRPEKLFDYFLGEDGSVATHLAQMGGGDDTVESAASTVQAGPGNDIVSVTSVGIVHGGAGDDRVTYGVVPDYVPGDPISPASFDGGDGADTFAPFTNADGGGPEIDEMHPTFDGGTGPDSVLLSDAPVTGLANDDLERVGVNFSVTADMGDGVARWGEVSGKPVESLNFRSIQTFRGSRHHDFLTGSRYAERIEGGRGDDRIHGLGSHDTLVGGYGSDSLDGGAGYDRAFGGPGPDHCHAEVRNSC